MNNESSKTPQQQSSPGRRAGGGKSRLLLVVGGQFGSEAKGKAVQYLASHYQASLAVRSGGINAGHTVEWETLPGREGIRREWATCKLRAKYVSRSLPSAFLSPGTGLCLSAGAFILPSLLMKELGDLQSVVPDINNRLFIDKNAFVIRPEDAVTESGWGASFGSTQTGTGAALVRRIQRRDGEQAKDHPLLRQYVVPSVAELVTRNLLSSDFPSTVILEGTQGYGLSLLHGPWPFVTSRDTTASALLTECGIPAWDNVSPPRFDVEVCMVIRTYPIRVGGNSGPMREELSWTEIQERAGIPTQLEEITSVTKRVRRVGQIDWDQLRQAVRANRPNYIALHGLDYISGSDLGKKSVASLSTSSRNFVEAVEDMAGVPVRLMFTGPQSDHLIDTYV